MHEKTPSATQPSDNETKGANDPSDEKDVELDIEVRDLDRTVRPRGVLAE
jgi:hypothetical protein